MLKYIYIMNTILKNNFHVLVEKLLLIYHLFKFISNLAFTFVIIKYFVKLLVISFM